MGYVKIRDDLLWAKQIEGDNVLKLHIASLPAGAMIDLEVDGIVGHWENAGLHAQGNSNRIRGLGQRLSLGKHGGAMDVSGEVAVAQVEPIGAPIAGEAFQSMKRFPTNPPAFCGIDDSRQGVSHDVEVRRNLQAVENDVVAGVDNDRQQARVHHFIKTEEQF